MYIVTYILAIVMYAMVRVFPNVQLPFNKEVLLGLIIGTPMLLLLTKLKTGKIDQFLGNLSYGMYLNHFFIMYIMKQIPADGFSRAICVIASVAFSIVSYYIVEKPMTHIRKKYRLSKCMN